MQPLSEHPRFLLHGGSITDPSVYALTTPEPFKRRPWIAVAKTTVRDLVPRRLWIWVRRVAFILGLTPIAALAGCSDSPMERALSASPAQAGVMSGEDMNALIEADFVARDPDYREKKTRFGERLRALASSLADIQATGRIMACSTQMYLEADWLYEYTVDWNRLDQQLARLAESLTNLNQNFARRQSPGSGLWGVCYDEWFLQVEATLAALEEHYEERLWPSPPYPIRIPDKIDTPEKLKAYLAQLLVSDVAATGRDNRGELGNLTTILSSALFKDYLREYLHQAIGRRRDESRVQTVYRDFLRRWQDPQTGYWGAWYRSRGRIYKTVDLSITYHTIVYLRGKVPYWPQIIDTTLRIRNDPYPYGWLHDGHLNNHNNYDVARILKYGWSHMSAAQKQQASDAIREMLAWTLEQSLNPDGSFKTDLTFFSSVAADYYFGVSFLDVIGFWDRGQRFWTKEDFPGSDAVCRRIKARMAGFKYEDPQARVALEKLNAAC
jgi:hypothetical protein